MNKLIDIALKEVGYLEKVSNKNLDHKTNNAGSGNYTKYWRDIYPQFQGEPWCLCFIVWCLQKAYGKEKALEMLCTKEYTFYTPTQANYFKKSNKWSDKPKVGSVIFFKNSKRIHHVGIVKEIKGDTVVTIEGNTSNGYTVIENGGAVCQKQYNISNPNIAGYGIMFDEEKNYTIGWHQDNKGWWYADTSKTWFSNCWQVINHHKYYFDKDGYAVKGLQTINNSNYYFQESGDLQCALCKTDSQGKLVIWNL